MKISSLFSPAAEKALQLLRGQAAFHTIFIQILLLHHFAAHLTRRIHTAHSHATTHQVVQPEHGIHVKVVYC